MNPKEHRSAAVENGPLIPLGVFGVIAEQRQFEQLRSELERRVNQLAEGQERQEVVRYLRGGAPVFALMESTHDFQIKWSAWSTTAWFLAT